MLRIAIQKIELRVGETKVLGLGFFPEQIDQPPTAFCAFTHGFTSHKGSILNWAIRTSEGGLPTVLFDLPGHYLGSFNEISSFETFRQASPQLFLQAMLLMKQQYSHSPQDLFVGGHSLGALIGIKSLMLPEWEQHFLDSKRCAIGVGFGQRRDKITHVYESPLFEKTMQIRAQLVSPNISPDVVFPWVRNEKITNKVTGQRIHLISGEDDIVVSKDGAVYLKEILEGDGNNVSLDLVARLPHHQPESATTNIFQFIKTSLQK